MKHVRLNLMSVCQSSSVSLNIMSSKAEDVVKNCLESRSVQGQNCRSYQTGPHVCMSAIICVNSHVPSKVDFTVNKFDDLFDAVAHAAASSQLL